MASLAVGADGSFSFGSSNNSVSSLEDGPTGGGSRNGKDLWRKAALLKEHSSLFRVAHSEEMQQKWSGASIALGNDEIVGALGTDMTGETDVEKVQACAKLRVQALKASLAEGMSPPRGKCLARKYVSSRHTILLLPIQPSAPVFLPQFDAQYSKVWHIAQICSPAASPRAVIVNAPVSHAPARRMGAPHAAVLERTLPPPT